MPVVRDDWQNIPTSTLEADQRQQAAQQWGTQQRAALAGQWADQARGEINAQYPDLAQYLPPTSSDSLTNPVPAPVAPDLAAGVATPAAAPLQPVEQTGPPPPAVPPATSTPPAPLVIEPAAAALVTSGNIRGQDFTPNEFNDPQLSAGEAAAACGPAQAVAFARAYGRNPTLKEALDIAKTSGWTMGGGMNGIANQKTALTKMGIPVTVTDGDWNKITDAASNGQIVGISTPLHYFTATDFDPATGKYYVGTSGMIWLDQRKNSPWLTRAQIESYGQGSANGALFLNSGGTAPVVQPSTFGSDSGLGGRPAPTPSGPSGSSPATASLSQPAVQPASFGADSGLGGQPTPVSTLPPAAPASKFEDILNQARQAVGYAGDQAQQAVTGFVSGGPQPMTAAQQPTPSDSLTNPTLATQPVDMTQSPPPQPTAFDALGQARKNLNDTGAMQAVNEFVIPDVARFARTGELPKDITEMTKDELVQQGPLVGGAVGPYGAALKVPANQSTATMLESGLPKVADDSVVTRLVRMWTNRNVSADQFQEAALKGAGLDIKAPAEALDLSSRIRQFATDGAVKVAEDTVLKPAVQSLGGDQAARKVLSSVLIHQNNQDVATATGQTYRSFPGGGSLIQSQTALQQMEQRLGPAEWSKVQGAAGQVYGLVKDLRQTMLDAGLIDKQTFNAWNGQMPHWVPTRILDYLDEAGGPKIGSKITLSDNGVRHYTLAGTDKFQEDPLASVLGLVSQVERNARKNEAVNALLELDKLGGKPTLVKTDAPVTAAGTVVQYIRDGVVERYVAPPQLAAVINGPVIDQAPGFVRAWTGFQRAVTTVLSPAFALVRNPSLDVPEYMLRETARAGGNPLVIPHIVSELVRGYADAFQGLLQGEFRGAGTQSYLKGGGSGSTLVSTFENRKNIADSLSRATPFEIKSMGDVQRILKDIVTLKPVAAIAERTELGPRVAAQRLATQRGQTPLRSTMAGRTVTMDFAEGGTLAKTINSFVPFFNAGVQGSVIPVRMFRENPAGALASATMMVGAPTVIAEAWNNSDPQRAKDYQDVPQYLKQGGAVIMMPGEAPTDAQGNRKPQFWWINMRGMAPFGTLAREAVVKGLQAAGNKDVRPEDWQQLLADLLVSASPVRANTIGDVPGAVSGPGLVPGAGVGVQLQQNRDFFRNSDIATSRNDALASPTAKLIADNLTAVAQLTNPRAEIRPSQVDFAVRGLLGGVGASLLGAGDIVQGKGQKDNTPQNLPVVGGIARAAGVRGDTGETFRDTRDNRTPADLTAIFKDAGLPASYQPAAVDSTVSIGKVKVPLLQAEQTKVQTLTSQYLAENLRPLASAPEWQSYTPERKQKIIEGRYAAAHKQAELEVYADISDAEIKRRLP